MAAEDRRTRADKMRRLLEPQLAPVPAAKPAAPADVPAPSVEERAHTGLMVMLVLLLGLAVR